MEKIIQSFLAQVNQRNQNEPEFMQAVTEVAETVIPYIVQHDIYYGQNILMRMVEPERVVSFRVAWIDDQEEIQVNRGYRIEMNSAIGPYKGGLRFHPSVNLSVLKFLAIEKFSLGRKGSKTAVQQAEIRASLFFYKRIKAQELCEF